MATKKPINGFSQNTRGYPDAWHESLHGVPRNDPRIEEYHQRCSAWHRAHRIATTPVAEAQRELSAIARRVWPRRRGVKVTVVATALESSSAAPLPLEIPPEWVARPGAMLKLSRQINKAIKAGQTFRWKETDNATGESRIIMQPIPLPLEAAGRSIGPRQAGAPRHQHSADIIADIRARPHRSDSERALELTVRLKCSISRSTIRRLRLRVEQLAIARQ